MDAWKEWKLVENNVQCMERKKRIQMDLEINDKR
jgi:hypothetical protein